MKPKFKKGDVVASLKDPSVRLVVEYPFKRKELTPIFGDVIDIMCVLCTNGEVYEEYNLIEYQEGLAQISRSINSLRSDIHQIEKTNEDKEDIGMYAIILSIISMIFAVVVAVIMQ